MSNQHEKIPDPFQFQRNLVKGLGLCGNYVTQNFSFAG